MRDTFWVGVHIVGLRVMKLHFAVLALLICLEYKAFADAPLPQILYSCPVLITLANGSFGSGLFLNSSNHFFLVTAGHVLFDKHSHVLISGKAEVSWHLDEGTNHYFSAISVNLDFLNTNNQIKLHSTHDVAVVRLCSVLPDGRQVYQANEFVCTTTNFEPVIISNTSMRRFADVTIGNDAFVFGYPSSIGLKASPQFDYTRPLLRRGIIAGINPEAKTIIIDAPVFFGNSGGPVLEKRSTFTETQYAVVGIVTQYIPFYDVWDSEQYQIHNVSVSNSGYSVVEPIDFVMELLWDN